MRSQNPSRYAGWAVSVRVSVAMAAALGVLGFFSGCQGGAGAEGSGDDATAGDDDPTTGAPPDDWSDLLEPVAGTRLRPIMRTAEDGTRAHVGWFDTEFDAPCEFREATDGVLRCVPVGFVAEPWRYADADCTEPVVSPAELPESGTAAYTGLSSCRHDAYYEIGEEITTDIYYDANGPCEVFSQDPGFRRVVEIPADAFVGATAEAQPGNDRIVPIVLQADDGSRQIFGAWDQQRQEEVEPVTGDDGVTRWVARWLPNVYSLDYADPQCTQPVAIGGSCWPSTASPRTAGQYFTGLCGTPHDLYDLGAELQTYYRAGDGGCVAQPTASGQRAWAVGEPITVQAFAEASAIDDGQARLRHDVHTGPGGAPLLPSRELFDRLLSQSRCDWAEDSASGELLCIPAGAALLTSRYLDAACTDRVATRGGGSCAGPALYAYAAALIVEIVDVVGQAGTYALDEQGDCAPSPPEGETDGDFEDTEGIEYYLVGDPADVEAARAMDVVE